MKYNDEDLTGLLGNKHPDRQQIKELLETKKSNMFVAVPPKFYMNEYNLSGSAWRVLLCMLGHDYKHLKTGVKADGSIVFKRKEKVFTSQNTIAKELGMPLITVKRAVRQLKSKGLIEVVQRFNNSAIYYIQYR